MIPRHLRISGFLSYRDPVEIDFDQFELACISGQNGAGKSSMLDALTWVLFGEARGKGTDVIHLNPQIKGAEVSLVFDYEGNTFKVQRTLPRTKSAMLEFQVLDGKNWKPLTEKSTRETQARIQHTLRLDYETFINASFFLQGKADQFTQKKPGERKTVLGSILGLEIWEQYKVRAAEKRKLVEDEMRDLEGRIAEIDNELAEESVRRARLADLEQKLERLARERAAQEKNLELAKTNFLLVQEQTKAVEKILADLTRERQGLNDLQGRLRQKETEQQLRLELIRRAADIEKKYTDWQTASGKLQAFETAAAAYYELDKQRSPLTARIAAEEARLRQELRSLQTARQDAAQKEMSIREWQAQLLIEQQKLTTAKMLLLEIKGLDQQKLDLQKRMSELKGEVESHKGSRTKLSQRLDSLKVASGAACPLCGQALTEEHRLETIAKINAELDELSASEERAQEGIRETSRTSNELIKRSSGLSAAEAEKSRCVKLVSQLTERIEASQAVVDRWNRDGKDRLQLIEEQFSNASFSMDERRALADLDQKSTALNYDSAAHEALRRSVAEGRAVEAEYHALQTAQDVNQQIQGEIASLSSDLVKKESLLKQLEGDHQAAKDRIQQNSATVAMNPQVIESEVLALREEENLSRDQVGAARQKVEVLASQKIRRQEYDTQREEQLTRIARYKTLERSFGRDGVPALLIEQALPQIEQKANDLLDRLSDGAMSLRFVTQAEYKDKKREDLKETLDIQISDSSGIRAYEMYSGGEAFRVNFAIRLALSEILAQRKGARLQTLVIDEGFGSQDALGRQRLVEAINLVRRDFAKILVITHLDELKDAFPTRIEIDKTDQGSTVKIV